MGVKDEVAAEETDFYFDNDAGDYDPGKKPRLLRIRVVDNKPVLTFKDLKNDGGFKKEETLKVNVSSREDMQTLLEHLGFHCMAAFTKRKTSWQLHDCDIELHEFAFGTFVEIKGAEEAITQCARALGFDFNNHDTQCYCDRYTEYCAEKGLEVGVVI